MKKIVLFNFLIISCLTGLFVLKVNQANATYITRSEDFETYPNSNWSTAGGTLSTAHSYSPTHSITGTGYLRSTTLGSDTYDMATTTIWIYTPSSMSGAIFDGFFGLNYDTGPNPLYEQYSSLPHLKGFVSGGYSFACNLAYDSWQKVETQWNFASTTYKIFVDGTQCGGTFDTGGGGTPYITYPQKLDMYLADAIGGAPYIDDFSVEQGTPPPSESYITITSPASGSTTTSPFTLNFDYGILNGDTYNKAYIIFQDWLTTSCPLPFSQNPEDWWNKYGQGLLYYQSPPFYSSTFSSTTGSSSIAISNLPIGSYNCNICALVSPDGSEFLGRCPNYTLNIGTSTPAYQPPLVPIWNNYYASNTILGFTTSTGMFNGITEVLNNLSIGLSSFANSIETRFNANDAYTNGNSFGAAIPLMFGYLDLINQFFNGLPLYQVFIFCIIVQIIVIVVKMIKTPIPTK